MSTQIPSELQPGSRATRALPQAAAARALDTEARTVELAFSSEEPCERWWGVEVLDHSTSSIRLGRLMQGGAVLMDHDTRDQVGVVESVRIDADRVARAVVRFGRSVRASEVFQDVIDGIRRNVSVGYMVHNAVLVEKRDGCRGLPGQRLGALRSEPRQRARRPDGRCRPHRHARSGAGASPED